MDDGDTRSDGRTMDVGVGADDEMMCSLRLSSVLVDGGDEPGRDRERDDIGRWWCCPSMIGDCCGDS